MSIFRFSKLVLILISLNITLYAQSFYVQGQLWISGESVEEQPDYKFQLGYIPTFSAYYELSKDRMLDLEWSYSFGRSYFGDSLEEHHDKLYRGWLRYSTQFIEARLGLQKVSFGPAQVLRPLAWFDTIDPEDPTAQTDGVEAFRFRFFPAHSFALMTWIMKGESDTLSYGGRGELSTTLGEWGLTLHQSPDESNTQIGVDFRYDGFIGLWFEGAGFISENQNIDEDRHTLMTLGADYTFPLGAGLLIMSETMRIKEWSSKMDFSSTRTMSSIMAGLPIGMFHNFMLIANFDWDEDNTYNYLRWSSIYDHFSINCMVTIDPNRDVNDLELMFIYNH